MVSNVDFWTTTSELEFIRGVIARHRLNRSRLADALRRLHDGYKLRSEWGRIDRVEVMTFVQNQLREVGA